MVRNGWEQYSVRRDAGPPDSSQAKVCVLWRDKRSGVQMVRLCASFEDAEGKALTLRVVGHDDVRVERVDITDVAAG
jgi:hypothetical protein